MFRIGLADFLVISWAVLGAQLIRFGSGPAQTVLSNGGTSVRLKYTAFSAVLVGAWMLMLCVHDAYDHRVLGHGPEEYKAVAVASSQLFGMVANAGSAQWRPSALAPGKWQAGWKSQLVAKCLI